MATRGRHAAQRRLGRWLLPSSAALFLWLADNDPAGLAGITVFLALGALLSLFYPLLVILALQAPGALVPGSVRRWWHGSKRPVVHAWLRRTVKAADRYSCAYCGSSADIQVDHIKPWAVGGRMSFWNFMSLCGACNKVKSDYWVFRSGRVNYHPWREHEGRNRSAAEKQAAAILRCELRRRWSLVRLIRAAVAL